MKAKVEFKRSEKTIRKQILIDGIESEVKRDAKLYCSRDGHVYYHTSEDASFRDGLRVQFPKKLREADRFYIADIYKRTAKSGAGFWSAYKGTIRNLKGNVIG